MKSIKTKQTIAKQKGQASWNAVLISDDTILVRYGDLKFNYHPTIINGKGILNNKSANKTVIDWTGCPYADDNGKLPIAIALGLKLNKNRKKAMETALKQLVDKLVKKSEDKNQNVAMTKILKAVDDEPELPGPIPDELVRKIFNSIPDDQTVLNLTNILRTLVRLTKSGIRDRIKSIAK